MDDPWVQAVKKLYELTEAGELHWEVVDTFTGGPMPLGKVYSTEVKERRIVAYVTRLNAMGKPLGLSELFAKPPFVSDSIVIQFVDDKMQPQWRWPGTSEAWKLWDSIEFQVAAGHGFLEALLAT